MSERPTRRSKAKQQKEADYGWRDKFKPTIYIPREDQDSLRVLLERNPLCDIYWFRWPHDGYLYYLIPDYEPVVIIFVEQQVYGVLTRPHWGYMPYMVEEDLFLPLEVVFKVLLMQHMRNGGKPKTDLKLILMDL